VHFIEIAVIVRYRDYGLTRSVQLRQNIKVELAPKFWVLIGGPFVQQQDRPLLQQAYDEREAFALTGG
jgi:hypothetical protein